MPNGSLVSSVEPIIRKAGDILRSFFYRPISWKDKGSDGLVTEVDHASEAFLIEHLGALLSDASFFAEESGACGDKNAEYCWIVDPLDGTTNFAFGIPHFCVSVALAHKGVPIFGMIYSPMLDELFYAERGAGAFLNGKPIGVTRQRPLNRLLILAGFSYVERPNFADRARNLVQIRPNTYSFRHLGAIALDQAYVACGRADAVLLQKFPIWDTAAGLLLIHEAGGLGFMERANEIIPVSGQQSAVYAVGNVSVCKALGELLSN